MALIYKITNKQNGKVYIGQTKRSLDWRLENDWCGHFQSAFDWNSQTLLCRALRKYGKDGFTYEILEEKDNTSFGSKEDLQVWLYTREKYWIKFYNSFSFEKGYNMTEGGEGTTGYTYSEDLKKLISKKTKQGMAKLGTKDLCNPCKNMTKKEKDAWLKRKSDAMYTLIDEDPDFISRVSEETKKAMQKKDVKDRHKKGLQKAKEEGKLTYNRGRIYINKNNYII
jgi:group I intron endonuclease